MDTERIERDFADDGLLNPSVVQVLQMLAQGQGFAKLEIAWDSACGVPQYSVFASRERDGLTLDRRALSEEEFVELLAAATHKRVSIERQKSTEAHDEPE